MVAHTVGLTRSPDFRVGSMLKRSVARLATFTRGPGKPVMSFESSDNSIQAPVVKPRVLVTTTSFPSVVSQRVAMLPLSRDHLIVGPSAESLPRGVD